MKKFNLTKILDKATQQFWLAMADAAPDEQYRKHYLNQILKSDLRVTPLTEFHEGVKGVTMFCPHCLSEFPNVHPDKESFCANGHPATRVRSAKEIVAVQSATDAWIGKRMMRR